MRVSTAMLFQRSLDAMMEREAALLRTQQQLSSGRRLLSPADDPLAASRALVARDQQAQAGQYGATIAAAQGRVALLEARLADAGDVLQAARELLVAAGNGAYSDSDRAAIVLELRERRDQLLGIANSTDGEGRHLFAGYADTQPPFADTAAGVVYGGDQGRRQLAIGPARNLEVTASGHAVFEQGRSGNGVFEVSAAPSNGGAAIVSTGRVYDAALLTGHRYRIVFGAGGAYDVLDLTLGATLSTGNAWASGQAIRAEGLEFSVQGTPAAGDAYELAPSTRQSVFRVLDDALMLVAAPAADARSRARLATGLANSLAEIDSSLESVLATRAELGASLRELEEARSANEARGVLLATEISALEDADLAKVASDLAREKLALEAAQRAHLLTTRLSLFDYF